MDPYENHIIALQGRAAMLEDRVATLEDEIKELKECVENLSILAHTNASKIALSDPVVHELCNQALNIKK